MKITINVDCTPEEARRFMGLPDLQPVHDLYLDKVKKAMDDMSTADGMVNMMKSWGPMSDQMMSGWTNLMGGRGKSDT
jgi:hypothetical protein